MRTKKVRSADESNFGVALNRLSLASESWAVVGLCMSGAMRSEVNHDRLIDQYVAISRQLDAFKADLRLAEQQAAGADR